MTALLCALTLAVLSPAAAPAAEPEETAPAAAAVSTALPAASAAPAVSTTIAPPMPVVPSTAALAAAPLPRPSPHAAGIRNAARRLSFLLENTHRTDPAKLDAAAKDIAALDAKIAQLLGPDLLRELEDRDKERSARAELIRLRSLLLTWYAEKGGVYPHLPEELVPAYLPALPALELPGHAASAAVEPGTGEDLAAAVTDSGGWLYFGDEGAANRGLLLINCSHKDTNGNEFYKY